MATKLTKMATPWREGAVPVVLTAMGGTLLAVAEGDLLWTAQEQNLFLHTPLFFEQLMVRPGGLLSWAACYLTQFFYHPALGAALLTVLWVLLLWLLGRAFRLADAWLGLLPVGALLATLAGMGYWVYYLKLPGHPFAATLGTLAAVAMVWAYRALPPRCGLRTAAVLTAAAGYPLLGAYALWGTALMALLAWRTPGSHRWTDSAVAAAAIAAVPVVCYHTCYHQTNIANIYAAALPLYNFQGQRFWSYYLPFIIVAASISLMVLPLPRRRWLRAAVLAAAAATVATAWNKDGNLHRELAMRRAMEHGQWERVLQTARSTHGEPTRAMCMMQNLALWRTGRLERDMRSYPNGAARPAAPFAVRTVHTVGKKLYLEYGLPNYCYRWCMEDGVEYGWTVERLRLMAQCSLLNGEYTAAQRYLNALKKTDFHRRWALSQEACLYRPQAVARQAALRPILPLLRRDNFLTADQSQLELFLVEHLLSTPGTTREQQELARLTALYYQKNRYPIAEP